MEAYLKHVDLSREEWGGSLPWQLQVTTNASSYPFGIFARKGLRKIDFEPITIFYGGNGSGKTTLLNAISMKLGAGRKNVLNLGTLFDLYLEEMECEGFDRRYVQDIKYISSDDVFDELLELRATTSGASRRKDELMDEYRNLKYGKTYQDIKDDSSLLHDKVDANRLTMSKYVRGRLRANNLILQSNGETALDFWQKEITENSIYFLDEPENSLSAVNQIKLAQFIEESARFYGCQFVISTHSPFLLAINYALIYDLDARPVSTKKWYELENVKVYYDFFKDRSDKFE